MLFFWPNVFGEAWGTQANQPLIFMKIVVFGPRHPKTPTKTLGQTTTSGSLRLKANMKIKTMRHVEGVKQ
jgi:hypothetical protein